MLQRRACYTLQELAVEDMRHELDDENRREFFEEEEEDGEGGTRAGNGRYAAVCVIGNSCCRPVGTPTVPSSLFAQSNTWYNVILLIYSTFTLAEGEFVALSFGLLLSTCEIAYALNVKSRRPLPIAVTPYKYLALA